MGHDETRLLTENSIAKPSEGHSATRATQAVLVLGMHRSGTSATAAVLAALGIYAGEEGDLLPAHARDNPAGYWERDAVVAADDELLVAAGRSWRQVARFDSRDVPAAARRDFGRRMGALVGKLDARGGPWLIKDPRLCLLLPFWLELAPAAACVVVVRDPREIAASLSNTPRGVLTSQFPLALWEKYTQCLLSGLRGRRAVFVSYEKLLSTPDAEQARLTRSLGELGVELNPRDATQPAVHRELRRSMPEAHIHPTGHQQDLYRWLCAQASAPGTVRVDGFPESDGNDTVLAEFEAAFRFWEEHGRAQARADTAEQLNRIEAVLAAQVQERERWRTEFERQHERALQLTRSIATVEAQRDTLQREAQERDERIRHLQRETGELQRESGELRGHITDLQQGERALRSSWSWQLTAPLRGIANLFSRGVGGRAEQRLYRLYYAIPGLNAARKRAAILWVHRHLPWLTRHTLSYRLYQETQALIQRRTTDPELRKQLQRIDQARAANVIAAMQDPPLISIVMPVYNVEARWLNPAVESVRRQFYPHWQLCIADDASTRAETRRALDAIEQLGDTRIKLRRLPKNGGIAAASNAALELASGDFVGLLDNDDVLTRDALLEMAQRILTDAPDLLYSDEDKLDEDGCNVEPHFKPDYNEDYLFSINYICHFSVVRRALLQKIGGFRAGFDGAQDYDLLLRATEQTQRIAHVPKVLYHWRRTANSTAQNASAKPQTSEAGLRALNDSLARRGVAASAQLGPFPNTYRVRHTLRGTPLVSILIPFRDKPELLETCIGSILRKTSYANFEIVGIDNGSSDPATQRTLRELAARDARVRFVRYDAPFNYSAINNFAATQARGEHLLFLNNDTEVMAADWLAAMLAHSQRPEVGVVGAKLLYADDTVQHSGVIVGIGGVAGHAHLFLPADAPGYFSRAQLTQDLSAVTFACAMTRREIFEQLGGLNDQELRIAFNDVDYCLRAREAGYRVVYVPDAVLHHYESKSRGYEDTPEKQTRFAGEIRYMQQRHGAILRDGDPCYNPNLSLTHCYQPDPGYADALPL